MEHYLITARLALPVYPDTWRKQQQRLPAMLLLDVFNGWSEYHCALPRGGAARLVLRRDEVGWESRDARWAILEVRAISQEEFLEAQRNFG